jgi:HrpA-like RNA helicase
MTDSNKPKFPENLKLWQYLKGINQFDEQLKTSRIIICQAPTGTGKTNSLTYHILYKKEDKENEEDPDINRFDKIYVTEPRQIAAESPAETVMKFNRRLTPEVERRLVGFKHRANRSPNYLKADLLFITEGSLVNIIKNEDLSKKKYCFIIDEAHEKTKDMEELLIYLKYKMNNNEWNPDSRIIILSATIPGEWITHTQITDTSNPSEVPTLDGVTLNIYNCGDNNIIKKFYNDKKVTYIDFKIETTKTITEYYSLRPIKNYMLTALELAKRAYDNLEKVLIFVSGNGQIKKMRTFIESSWKGENIRNNVFYISSIQDDWIDPSRKKEMIESVHCLIIATSILETSVTIEHLTTVIDTGISRQPIYIPELDLNTLTEHYISDLNRIQRRGRVGRTKSGKAFYLYTEKMKDELDKQTLSSLTTTDITTEVFKYKRDEGLYELFKTSEICKKFATSIDLSIKKLQSYNLIDKNETITNLGLQVLNLLNLTKLELKYICVLFYSINNKLKCFNRLLWLITFIDYVNKEKDYGEEIFQNLSTKRQSYNNIIDLITNKEIFNDHTYGKIKLKYQQNYEHIYKKLYNSVPKSEKINSFSNDNDETKFFIKKALYSTYNLNIAKYQTRVGSTVDENGYYKLLNTELEIDNDNYFKLSYIPPRTFHPIKKENVLYMKSRFIDFLTIQYCVDVTDVKLKYKQLYLSQQIMVNKRINKLKEIIKDEGIPVKENTSDFIKKNFSIIIAFLKHLQKQMSEYDFIITGGYAVKRYARNEEAYITNDIDVKVYPKPNATIYYRWEIIDVWKEWVKNIKEKFYAPQQSKKGGIQLIKFAPMQTDSPITPILEIVCETIPDKGSYTIYEELKYRSKFYLINELLINTGDREGNTFADRYNKAKEQNESLETINIYITDGYNKFGPGVVQFSGRTSPENSAWEQEKKEWTEKVEERDRIMQEMESLFAEKVNSWIQQLENLRDENVYEALNSEAQRKQATSDKIVEELTSSDTNEGKVNLKVPFL